MKAILRGGKFLPAVFLFLAIIIAGPSVAQTADKPLYLDYNQPVAAG